MAKFAITITRLMKNNPREMTEVDCAEIYALCFQ